MSIEIKTALFNHCMDLVQDRIDAAEEAMESAQDAANENTKSSAGDKYETGRAMMQLERDKAAAHLATSLELRRELESINPAQSLPVVSMGSLVRSSQGWFFMSAALGRISMDGVDYWAISPNSPVGKLLMGREKGEKVKFNGREFEVLELS